VGLPLFACYDCELESRRGHGCLSLVSVVCCDIEADHASRVVLQECGASECDREATGMRGPWPTRGCCAIGVGFKNVEYVVQYSRCVKEGSIHASWCVVLPSVTSRVHECSNVCFCVCKMELFMSVCNKLKTSVT
jgi:hypothetical protein